MWPLAARTTIVACSPSPVSMLQAVNWYALRTLAGAKYTFTIDEGANGQDSRISVNYDGFIDDVSVPAETACSAACNVCWATSCN